MMRDHLRRDDMMRNHLGRDCLRRDDIRRDHMSRDLPSFKMTFFLTPILHITSM